MQSNLCKTGFLTLQALTAGPETEILGPDTLIILGGGGLSRVACCLTVTALLSLQGGKSTEIVIFFFCLFPPHA